MYIVTCNYFFIILSVSSSTDSDSIERPKSAMLKEPHPEYDPHEPMITSAFSEEDLRKADDAYEDTYKSDIVVTGGDYDPTKSFTLDTNIILPAATFSPHQDKPGENTASHFFCVPDIGRFF